jgi:hypothetical protein
MTNYDTVLGRSIKNLWFKSSTGALVAEVILG